MLAARLDTADRHRREKLAWKFPYHTILQIRRPQTKEEKLFARTVSVEWCGRWMVDARMRMGRAQGLHASRRLAVSDVSVGMELLPPLLHLLNLSQMTQGHFSGFGSLALHMCTLTSLVKCLATMVRRAYSRCSYQDRPPSPTLRKICNRLTDTLAFNPVKVHAILGLKPPFHLIAIPHSPIKAAVRTSLPSSSSNPPITDYQSTRPVLTQASTAASQSVGDLLAYLAILKRCRSVFLLATGSAPTPPEDA